MSQDAYPVSDHNRIRQVARRGHYDKGAVYAVLDACLIGHVAFIQDDRPMVIPMLFARRGNQLLFHGSSKSRLMDTLASGKECSMSVAAVDGLVLARSLFHHSMNYRSVMVTGVGQVVDSLEDRMEALKIISDKLMPQRWEDARLPNQQELKATRIVALEIDSAAAKIRTGGPVDDLDDMELPVWAGVVPLQTQAMNPIPDGQQVVVPDYINQWIQGQNQADPKTDH